MRDLLPRYEVYVTEWQDARFVPRAEGDFDLDTYVDYIIDFLRYFGLRRTSAEFSASPEPAKATSAVLWSRSCSRVSSAGAAETVVAAFPLPAALVDRVAFGYHSNKP